ncbi:MAG: MoxR family ATPase [Pseudomonadota bacterium]|nr:MoxR family ATPase [Pseudomonadota bacterium]
MEYALPTSDLTTGITDAAAKELTADVDKASAMIAKITSSLKTVIIGQDKLIERLIMAILADGHVLLEGLPGLAKTTTIKALGEVLDLQFKRVQFTPDLLPADITGTQVYSPKTSEFSVKKGAIFTNLLLADEINRAPAKVQSALLEAMQERQVTIGIESFALPAPFLTMATQNPIEQEGTYPLPEAQVDRFLFKIKITYTTVEDEQRIMKMAAAKQVPTLAKVASIADLLRMRDLAHQVHVADSIRKYIVELVFATRQPEQYKCQDLRSYIAFGASPRASINLEKTVKINAMLDGRTYVTPQDVKDIAPDILRHRIIPTYEAEAEGRSNDQIIDQILASVDVP